MVKECSGQQSASSVPNMDERIRRRMELTWIHPPSRHQSTHSSAPTVVQSGPDTTQSRGGTRDSGQRGRQAGTRTGGGQEGEMRKIRSRSC